MNKSMGRQMIKSRVCVAVLLAITLPVLAVAAEELLNDEEFLDFLGSWDGEDDEWLDLFDLAEIRADQDQDQEPDTDTGDVSEARKDED